MLGYILRRLALAIPTVLGVVTVVFLLIHLIPGDPADVMLGETAQAADKAALRARLGLNQPLPVQYARFMKRLARGNLGRSLATGRPVRWMLVRRFPATLELAAAGLGISLLIAVPLAAAAATRAGGWIDTSSMGFSLLAMSVPNFTLGPLLILALAIKLEWLPVSGRGGLSHLALPALTLGLGMAAVVTRLLRAALIERLGDDYIRTARAKGLSEGRVVLMHALRNAALPVVTIVGLQAGSLLAGSIVTETIFSWPGLGRLTLQAIQMRDYPVVQGCVLTVALTYVIVNLATDVAYAAIDPRLRLHR